MKQHRPSAFLGSRGFGMGSGNKEWKNRDGCRYNPMMWDWDNHRRPTKGFKIQCHPPFGCEFLSSSVATRLGWNSRLAYFSHATSAECSFRADESCVTRNRNAGVHDSHLLYIHTRPFDYLPSWPSGPLCYTAGPLGWARQGDAPAVAQSARHI